MNNSDVELCDGVNEQILRKCMDDIFEEDRPVQNILCQQMAFLTQVIGECGEALCGKSCPESSDFFFNETDAANILADLNGCDESLCTIKLSTRSYVLLYSLVSVGVGILLLCVVVYYLRNKNKRHI